MNPARPDLFARLMAKTTPEPNTGCLPWLGYCCPRLGYGQVRVDGRLRTAHAAAYEAFHGSIPPGLEVDHAVCQQRSCVNVAHLEAVTHRVNVLRSNNAAALNARKTHCLRGHELVGDNLMPSKRGVRDCRACRNARRLTRPAAKTARAA